MRLTDLDPRWLELEGRKVGFLLRCPHCQGTWLSCMFEARPVLTGIDGQPSQFELFDKIVDDVHEVVPCRKDFAWVRDVDNFNSMTVTPSLDASASGHWHGFIQGGEIK
jgi:hypothetical protein